MWLVTPAPWDKVGRQSWEMLRLSKILRTLGFFSIICVLFLAETAQAAQEPLRLPANAREHPRRVLILYGWNPKEIEKPQLWPVDTMTAELFQAPLEHLGYEVVYHNVGLQPLPDSLAADFAGIIIDGEIDIPPAHQGDIAEWLVQQQTKGQKLLFTGSFPFSEEDALDKLRGSLGVRGTVKPVPRVSNLKLAYVDDSLMNAETKVTAKSHEFRDLRSPDKARVFVAETGLDEDGDEVRSEPVFLCSWGGVWLEPFIVLRASEDHSLFYADPYKFLAAWLGSTDLFPAPDPSTRDGRRVFYSHIDGDGFPTPAEFGGHPICGEIIRDRILKVFPLPVTVSFVEADLRAEVDGLESHDAAKFQEIARSILALGNVRTASHSYSHPYVWFASDPNPGVYDEINLPLKPSALYPRILANREVRGSIDYINQKIAPLEKPVEVFLWSGNCRPGVEALRACREMGIENLNGGNTIISHLYPGLAGVAPRLMPWGEEIQIHASNQNEFMYTSGFNGPFFGGFANVIDTFECTETPRRLKPVNVYYHFYTGQHLSSLRAMEKIQRWVLSHPLHSLTTLQFAKLTRDSYSTKIFDLGPRHWMMQNAGLLRTYRLPAYLGKPDLEHCHGITGWTVTGDQMYLHTDGTPLCELTLVDTEATIPAHLFLVESSAEISFQKRTRSQVEFEAEDLRPIEMVFGGVPAATTCHVQINGQSSLMTADSQGRLPLALPAHSHVILSADLPST